LFSIADNRERGILLVGPDRADLVYLYRTRAEALRLDSPELRARGLLRGIRPNDSLRVVVSRRGHDICLSANGRNACGLSPGPTMGWALLVSTMVASERSPKWLVVVLDAAWLVLLALPIGYWSPGKGAAALLGAALLAAVAGAAVYAGSVVPPQAAYGALGLALGVVASRYFRRGPPAEPPA
jgi:hypothetical protein